MQIDDQERRKKHIEVILKAVADRFKSLGYAVIMQPRVICGRNAL